MDIQTLVNKYNEKIKALEEEINDIRNKRDTLLAVLKDAEKLFDVPPISSDKESPKDNITVISNKYSNMTWPNALIEALTDKGEMTGEQILTELFANGFQSNSKSVKSDMYGRLQLLEKNNRIESIKEGKQLKRFKIKKKYGFGLLDQTQNEREPEGSLSVD